MSLSTITYKGLDITVQLEQGKGNRNFSFVKNNIAHKIIVYDPVSNSEDEVIKVYYTEQKFDSDGTNLSNRTFTKSFAKDEFDKWASYNVGNFPGTWLEMSFSPTINTCMADYFEEPNLYCFNPLKNFEPFQPVIFSTTVTETSITVNVEEQGQGTLIYSKDLGVTWQPSNVFEGLTEGTEYNIWCATTIDLFPCRRVVQTLSVEPELEV